MSQVRVRVWASWAAGASAIAVALVMTASHAAARVPARLEIQIAAHKYAYRVSGAERPEIHAHEGDVIHVTFTAEDIPHSFTIDEPYRVSKRAAPGKPVTFEFLADKTGTFTFYCNLALDERCKKEVRGTLVVDARDR